MTNASYGRPALAHAALELTPPLIRETVLEDAEFQKEYEIGSATILTFHGIGVSIQHRELFDAVRRVLSDGSLAEVSDINGRKWQLDYDSKTGIQPTLTISRGDQQLILTDFIVLSLDKDTRLRAFRELVADVNLPAQARDKWRSILSKRAFKDEEFNAFHSDCLETPICVEQSIRNELASKTGSVPSLVPRSRRYFQRLVNEYDGSTSIYEYAAGQGRQLFERLFAWNAYEGFLFSLLLSSHSALTVEIPIVRLKNADLIRAFDFVDKYGDRMSQLGAIEVGLRVLPTRSEIEPALIRLIQGIRDDDTDGRISNFKLFSALFMLVDGELSRTRLLALEPPFYRRLASLSQAALIYRQFVSTGVDIASFCEDVFKRYRGQFYLQSFIDMRLEPRWEPDFAEAVQIKAECLDRILFAANNLNNVQSDTLYNALQTMIENFRSREGLGRLFLLGPLERTEDGLPILPSHLNKKIIDQLNIEEAKASSFIALANYARIFHVDAGQAILAVKVLQQDNYHLTKVESKEHLLKILNALATISAVTRSNVLADELRIVVSKYRHDAQYALSIREVIRIYLVAAASRADLPSWKEYIGDGLTELAFGHLDKDEGKTLHQILKDLCHAVPELWISCGRADAALRAFIGSGTDVL